MTNFAISKTIMTSENPLGLFDWKQDYIVFPHKEMGTVGILKNNKL